MGKRMKDSINYFFVTILVVVMTLAVSNGIVFVEESMAEETVNIAYIEASIGRAWKVEELPKRIGDTRTKIDFYPIYGFDKSEILDKVIKDKSKKVDAIVLQECSVYFPGPLASYKKRYEGWIKKIQYSGIQPIIATTVPPATSKGIVQLTKNFIKEKILGRDSRYEQIVDFNNWLRELAKAENLLLFDLEAGLRVNDTDRHMHEQFNSGDGVHLNDVAYKKLDVLFSDFLQAKRAGRGN